VTLSLIRTNPQGRGFSASSGDHVMITCHPHFSRSNGKPLFVEVDAMHADRTQVPLFPHKM
jgi:hypothetical protein